MTRRMRGVALVLLGVAVPACSVLAGLTDDYRLAGDSASTEGGSADGAVDKDGALPDGFVPGDGGPDALPDQLVGDGGRFCDTVAKAHLDFCEDFENAPLATGTPPNWTVKNDIGAVFKVAAGGMTGGARGLDVDGTTASTNTSRNAYLVRTLPAALSPGNYLSYDLQFDFMMVESGADYDVVGVLNFTGAAPEDHGVGVYPSQAVVGRLMPKTTGVAPALGAWHHAPITLTHGDAGTAFNRKITIDGEAGAAIVDATTGLSTAGTTTTEVRIGTFYTGYGAGRVHALLDNIVSHRE